MTRQKRSKKMSTTAKIAVAAIGIGALIGIAALASKGGAAAQGIKVSTQSGSGGSITSPDSDMVDPDIYPTAGQTVTLTITADSTHWINSVTVDGVGFNLTSGLVQTINGDKVTYSGSGMSAASLTIAQISTNHTVVVTFVPFEQVSYSYGAGGTVTATAS